MKTWKRAILSAAAAAVAVVALLLFTSALVLTAGAGAVSFMQTFHNAPASLPFPTPCTGVPGSFEVTQNGVLPVTVLTAGPSAGTSWATGTMTDDFVFILMDLTQPRDGQVWRQQHPPERGRARDCHHSRCRLRWLYAGLARRDAPERERHGRDGFF
jgi:hypothetical protein